MEGQMEVQKKRNWTVKILIIILSLIVIGSGGYIVFRVFFEKGSTTNDNKLYIIYDKDSKYYSFSHEQVNDATKETEGNYNCKNKNCTGFHVIEKYAIIYDDYYYVYDYKLNKATKVNLGTTEFEKLSIMEYKDKVYGIVVTRKSDQNVGFYSLEKNKYTIDFNYKQIYVESSPVILSKGYVFASKNEGGGTHSVVDMNSGKTVLTVEDTLYLNTLALGTTQKILYLAYEGVSDASARFYNEKFESLFGGKNYNMYEVKSNGNLILGKEKIFSEYNLSMQLVKNSREFKSVNLIVKDYVVVIDTDNYLKLVNYNGDIVATFVEMTSNLVLHSAISGYYEPKNTPHGIYLVVEDKNKSEEGKSSKGNEYYYDPTAGKTGVIENVTIGGYAKPILYLYPKNKIDISVVFEKPYLLTTTYPKFDKSWKVIANPNGDLYDQKGNYYYALYWEENGSTKVDFSTGFYVTKENAIEFLENKLTTIGLTSKERNEFIMYWLPILEKNEKSLVYFELTEERNLYNKLIINPTPDSLLRVAMHIKKVDQKINIQEQKLKTFKRTGFVAIEWGGVIH